MRTKYEKYLFLREKAGLTDYKVSKATGIATATLTCWKQGKYQPKIDKLQALADFFKVDLAEFLEAS